jgi:hypothetical protein
VRWPNHSSATTGGAERDVRVGHPLRPHQRTAILLTVHEVAGRATTPHVLSASSSAEPAGKRDGIVVIDDDSFVQDVLEQEEK